MQIPRTRAFLTQSRKQGIPARNEQGEDPSPKKFSFSTLKVSPIPAENLGNPALEIFSSRARAKNISPSDATNPISVRLMDRGL